MARFVRHWCGCGLLMIGVVSLPACEAGGVGDPCVPESEYASDFNGFDPREVYVESRSFQCETRLCLINHFQGRVSCPYGQQEEDLGLPGDAPSRCRIPGTQGEHPEDQITVPVRAWNTERSAKQTVYCSCRCDGPDPDARYCECPDGYTCTSLVPKMGLPSEQLVGSYCIKRGTEYDEADALQPNCREVPTHDSCPDPPLVNP